MQPGLRVRTEQDIERKDVGGRTKGHYKTLRDRVDRMGHKRKEWWGQDRIGQYMAVRDRTQC